jgi:hypothetical protein
MCPKVRFLKCVEFRENGHFRTFFRNFGDAKSFGNFRQKKSVSGKFHAKFFAEIGCIFTYEKNQKNREKTVFRNSGFSGFSGTTFPEIFRLYRFNLPVCTLLRRACSEKHRKCTNFSGISILEIRKNFQEISAVFRRFSFSEFRNFRKSDQFLRNLHSALLKWHNIAF